LTATILRRTAPTADLDRRFLFDADPHLAREERPMVILKIIAGGVIAGIVANVTGYVITGRLFHAYQAKTPHTWRQGESWAHYLYAAAIRIACCVGIGFLYAAIGTRFPPLADSAILRGVIFGSLLWAVTILPVILEVSLFVNWHPGFVVGLLLDWLVVFVLAAVAAAVSISWGGP
jgi:hypothetical protein